MPETEILELETRRKIFKCIAQNPGINLSAIATFLQRSPQLVDYHITYMEQQEIITIDKGMGYKRCYLKGKVGVEDKRLLGLLRQKIPMQIVLFLLQYPYSRYRDILKNLGISSPHFSYYLRKLVSNGVIVASMFGTESGYIVKNEKEIMEFLLRYKPSTVTSMVNETWVDFGPVKASSSPPKNQSQ